MYNHRKWNEINKLKYIHILSYAYALIFFQENYSFTKKQSQHIFGA